MATATIKRPLLCVFLGASVAAQTPAPQPKAHIIAYKEFNVKNGANPLFLDGVDVASLRKKGSYFVLEVTPGEHSIRSNAKVDELIIDALPDHTYFFQLVARDWTSKFFKFLRRSSEEGKLVLDMIASGKLQPIDPSDINDQSKVSLTLPDSLKKRN